MRILAAVAFTIILVGLRAPTAAGAEPFMPQRPKDMNKVIDLGNEVGHMLDKMPLENEQKAEDEESEGVGGRTVASWFVLLLWSSVGAGVFIYGWKQKHVTALVIGIVLSAVPFFIVDAIALLLVGALICALPWGLKWAGIGR